VIVDGPGHFLMMEAPEEFNLRLAEVIAEISEPG
jgi:pimeloyl-ACP methyl ester carboxylesterase